MTPDARRRRRRDRIAVLLGFSAFFVFPALPLGHTVGLAVPYVIAAALVALWVWRLRTTEWSPFAWMMLPLVLSGYWVLLVGGALAGDVVPKAIALLAMAFLVVVPTLHLLRAGHGDAVVLGSALAILVHSALGAYQVFAFERAEFPFMDLMLTNRAMAILTEDAETYVAWVRRPFGLFAEPSAMAACVGPWLVVLSSVIFARSGAAIPRWRRGVLVAALASGLTLVVASESGLAVATVAGAAVPALWAAFTARRSVVARGAALVVSLAIVGATALWWDENAPTRFELARNDSWQLRLASMQLALESVESTDHLVFGVGPGQSSAHVRTTGLGAHGVGVTAVWSVALAFLMETGLVGLVCMLALGGSIVLAIARSRARVAGIACAAVWLSGIVFGTSYSQQPALWTAMAALLAWPSVTHRG